MSNAGPWPWQRGSFRLDREQPYLALGHITLFVRDADLSLRFYRDQLGWSVVFDVTPGPGLRFVAVSPPDGTAVIALATALPGTPEEALIGRGRHVMLLTENVTATHRDWEARGVVFTQPPTHNWGGLLATFEDPDGNGFGLVGFDDISREVEARRRAQAERLEAERRSAQELEIARLVQARLFPQVAPPLQTLEYAGRCEQARRVGGDYYDFLELGHDRFGLVIADIAGKGMPAALLMASLQATLRGQCANAAHDLEGVLRSLNHAFFGNSPENAYATLFFAEYDDRARRLRYANCGHLPGLVLRRDGSLTHLGSTGTVIGIFEGWDGSVAHCDLEAGDTLLLYTDGATESVNAADEEYGEERLAECLRRHHESSAHDLLAAILESSRKWNAGDPYDDLTLIVAKCR